MHILAELQIKCGKRLVEQQHLGVVCNGTGNGHTLLLTARKGIDMPFFKPREVYKAQHFGNLFLYLFFGALFNPQTESNVFIHIKVRKQCITLKNGVNLALIRRNTIYFFALKQNLAAVRLQKAGYKPQGGCFTTTGGTQQSYKLLILNFKVKPVQNLLAVKSDRNVFKLHNIFFFHKASTFVQITSREVPADSS